MPKDTHSTLPADAELVLPDQVTVALAELAGAAREGLLALAVGTGLGVLGSLLDADVERLVGPKGRHQPDRAAVRHGTQPGRLTLGGRRVRVDRPRVRSADGTRELPLPTWQAFAATELLDQLALERMLAKLSTRRYQAGLEPVGRGVEQEATGTSKSAISRRFVAATERALAELLAVDLSGLDLVALMVDGIRVAEHCCVVALGITIDGTKVPLGLAEGATENATVVRDLLAGLRERGLEVTRPILVVIDGAKALRRAVSDVFDHPVIQRCQLHRSRNEIVCRFRSLGLLVWYAPHAHTDGGPWSTRHQVRGVAAAPERAPAAPGAGGRGTAAGPWWRARGRAGRRRQRDDRPQGRVRVGGRRGAPPARPRPPARWGPASPPPGRIPTWSRRCWRWWSRTSVAIRCRRCGGRPSRCGTWPGSSPGRAIGSRPRRWAGC
jgi:Transposase, Mutator family